MVLKCLKIGYKSGGNNSKKPFKLHLRMYSGLAFLNSAIQIILQICIVAITVLCGVGQRSKVPRKAEDSSSR